MRNLSPEEAAQIKDLLETYLSSSTCCEMLEAAYIEGLSSDRVGFEIEVQGNGHALAPASHSVWTLQNPGIGLGNPTTKLKRLATETKLMTSQDCPGRTE
jgi:hypothetical protein